MTLHAYRVGEMYLPGRTNWPEVAEYNYRGGAHELRLFYANLRPAEIANITRRPAEFGALYQAPVLFFLFRFAGDPDWSDCPYSWHLVRAQRPDEATVPQPVEELERALLHIVLVEATTGVVAGLRAVSLSIGLTRYLHQAISDQIAQPFDAAQYDAALRRISAAHPPAALARQAERMRVV